MKVTIQALLLSASLAPVFGLAIDRQTLEERNWQPPKAGKVDQYANSGNEVYSGNNGGKAKNGDTTAQGGFFGGDAFAIPIAKAGGGDTKVSSGNASNKNKGDAKKVVQQANSGNTVESTNNGGKASNGDTKAKGGIFKGTGVAVPVAIAGGGDTWVSSGDASNVNEKRNNWQPPKKQGSVHQSANSGNEVWSSGNGGKAKNGDTDSDGFIAIAVPIAVGTGGNTNVKSGSASNSNKNSKAGKVKQGSSSGNYVVSENNGGRAKNGDTDSDGGLLGVAIPVAIGTGGNTNVRSGDASNSSE